MSTVEHESRLLRLQEVAERLSISVVTLRRRIYSGDLPAIRLGPSDRYPLRIDERELERWLRQDPAERRETSAQPATRQSSPRPLAGHQRGAEL